jgi:uncharacterized membrane protein
MQKITFLLLILLSLAGQIEAHQGNQLIESQILSTALSNPPTTSDELTLVNVINWIGRFHLLFVHFPIALIVMTVLAEWLLVWQRKVIFDHAARFMIVSAAVFAPMTALLGLALSYQVPYEGLSLDLFEWHRYFGLMTTGLVLIAAFLRERYSRQYTNSLTAYYFVLAALFICLNLTGTFGGFLAFGFDIW